MWNYTHAVERRTLSADLRSLMSECLVPLPQPRVSSHRTNAASLRTEGGRGHRSTSLIRKAKHVLARGVPTGSPSATNTFPQGQTICHGSRSVSVDVRKQEQTEYLKDLPVHKCLLVQTPQSGVRSR